MELLVSVRSIDEALQAVDQPIDILDFKEPRLGALAPVEVSIWHEAVKRLAGASGVASVPLSAALGERDTAAKLAGGVPAQFSFAKAGPYGCVTPDELTQLWTDVRTSLPNQVELVAVAYADSVAAQSLSPEEVLRLAHQFGFRRLLIDTYVKDGRSSMDHLHDKRLREIRRQCNELSIVWMLAGSMREQDLLAKFDSDFWPDGFGVRGDVCQLGRASELSPDRIRQWRRRLDTSRRGLRTEPNLNRSSF